MGGPADWLDVSVCPTPTGEATRDNAFTCPNQDQMKQPFFELKCVPIMHYIHYLQGNFGLYYDSSIPMSKAHLIQRLPFLPQSENG